MVKRLFTLICCILFAFSAVGCSGKETTTDSNTTSSSRTDDSKTPQDTTKPSSAEETSSPRTDTRNTFTTDKTTQKTQNTTTSTATTKAATTTKALPPTTGYANLAKKVMQDMYSHYWTDKDGGHIIATHAGEPISGKPSMVWESAMLMLAMENYYFATGDADTKQKMQAHWNYLRSVFNEEQLVGRQGKSPNLASDDAGWSAMLFITIYRIFNDKSALELARKLIHNSYDYWVDGTMDNGIWYCDKKLYNGDQWKSIYSVSLLISALEYSKATKGTAQYDQSLYEKSMKLYNWIENNLRRDKVITYENGLQDGRSYTVNTIDYLYWTDFNVNRSGRTEKNGPDGGIRPKDITDNGSVSSLFGNMAMAAINVTLYEMTGEKNYLTKAVQTAKSLANVYNREGAFINDRDHNTNATFTYYYVTKVMTLNEITSSEREMFGTTAYNIANYCRSSNGYYYPLWRKSSANNKKDPPTSMMINATTATMVTAAALAEKLGLIRYNG